MHGTQWSFAALQDGGTGDPGGGSEIEGAALVPREGARSQPERVALKVSNFSPFSLFFSFLSYFLFSLLFFLLSLLFSLLSLLFSLLSLLFSLLFFLLSLLSILSFLSTRELEDKSEQLLRVKKEKATVLADLEAKLASREREVVFIP